MNPLTPAVAWLLVVAVLAVVAYFGPRQLRELAAVRRDTTSTPEDRAYRRNMAVRRLIGCAMLTVIAVLIAAVFVSGLDAHVSEDAPDRAAARMWAWTWVTVIVLLLAVVFLAGADSWAIRRYAARHGRQLRDDHKAKLAEELREWRRRRRRE